MGHRGGGRRKVKRKINFFYKLFLRVLFHSGFQDNIVILSAKLYIYSFICFKLMYLA